MTSTTPERAGSPGVGGGDEWGMLATIRRGVGHTPELIHGWKLTLLLAVVATAGPIVAPVVVQRAIDGGINADGGVDVAHTVELLALGAVALVLTSLASYLMTARLFTAAETGLARLRAKAFRHVHELPLATQDSERRGGLVSRVTSDIDQISQFVVSGGVLLVLSVGQIALATVVMVIYDWRLAAVVWICFAPLIWSLRHFQAKLSAAYGVVRRQVAAMLSAISEPVVGAATVRAYAVQERTQRRIDAAVDANRRAATGAQWYTAVAFSLGGISAGFANAGVIVVGVLLGVAGDLSAGKILAFAFLVTLFVGPVQMGTQILTDAQNAIAGWRRVLGLIETPAELTDPGESGTELPRRAVEARFEGVDFAYPGGPLVLRGVDLTLPAGSRVAIVGETGSGKTTLGKLLTRLADPSAGRILLDGLDLREIRNASLRRRVVLVPQEGFLFDDTLLANVRYGDLDASAADVERAGADLGLDDWLRGLANGIHTRVGPRGELLSNGERQLVALLRAHVADADLLVLDEATSAVDPALEARINAALERLMQGRTSVTIAHRLSVAESADLVVVVDQGRVVQRGTHAELVDDGGVYGRLHASWVAQRARAA